MPRLVTLLALLCAFAGAAHAATFTVSSTADLGAGSLRQAILDANANGSGVTDTINFNIPGAGVQIITIATELPDITTPVLIDGDSQPGSSPNTQSHGSPSNAVIRITLDGVDQTKTGLTFLGDGSTVRGLSVERFFTGITVAANNVTVAGMYIGTDAAGALARPNVNGILIEGGGSNRIGSVTPANRNVISGNTTGINVTLSEGNTISGNYIGLAGDAVTPLAGRDGIILQQAQNTIITSNAIAGQTSGPFASGIEVSGGSMGNIIAGNRIGTLATGVGVAPNAVGIAFVSAVGTPANNTIGTPGEPNVIANSLTDGISMAPSAATRNRIQYNNFLNNGALAIDLNADGPSLNDALDADAGANLTQNYPVITSAVRSPSGNAIATGTLASAPLTQYTIQLHYAVTCDPSGFGEGSYVAETTVNTDAAGNASFVIAVASVPAGGNLTATAIDPNGNTSEFSACAALVAADAQPSVPAVGSWGLLAIAALLALFAIRKL